MDPEKQKLLCQLSEMGDVVLITNGNRFNLNENGTIALKTQVEAILYFLQRLDIDMVSSVLEDTRTYQDFAKPLFIKKLDNALDKFIEGFIVFSYAPLFIPFSYLLRKSNTKSEYKQKSNTSYKSACKNGWIDEITSHYNEIRKPSGFWNNFENVKIDALNYYSRSEYKNKSKG